MRRVPARTWPLLPVLALLLLLGTSVTAEDCQPVEDVVEAAPAPGTFYITRNNTRTVASVGDDISLQCQIRSPEKNKVAWIYKQTRRLLTLQDRSFTQDQRVSADFDSSRDVWSLRIRNISAEESGVYQCQVSSHPWDRLQFHLKVADPNKSESGKQRIPLVKEYNVPGFSISHADLCPGDEGREVKVVILVQSAADHANTRSVIRHSWARPAIARDDVVFAFMLAQVDDSSLQKTIEYENSLYEDIVQANFMDHYNNLTLKTLASFDWFDRYCSKAKYLLKVDDDVFLNVANLITFIEQNSAEKRTIFGNVVYSPAPDRDPNSRYYASPKIWDKTKYPRYTGGPLYLVSGDSVREVYHRVLQRPYFFIEDVTVTGIGAKLAGVKRQRAPEFFTYSVPTSDTCLLRLLVGAHQMPRREMPEIWARVNDRKILCPYHYSPALWKPCALLKAQSSLKHCVLTLFSSSKN